MPSFILGKDAAIYYSTTELTGTNTATVLTSATELLNVMDVSVDMGADYVDITTRADAAAGFKTQAQTYKNASVTFDAKWIPGDTAFDAIVAAWTANSTIAMFILDQKKNATTYQGLVGNFFVAISKEEPLADIQKASITLTLAANGAWYKKPTTP